MKIGFVGLGVMGLGIVPRLHGRGPQGHRLEPHARTRRKPLIDAGMRWADTPRAVAEASDVVFSDRHRRRRR